MFVALARFPIASAHRDVVLDSLDRSTELMRAQPGFMAYQLLSPEKAPDTRVAVMVWESKQHFLEFYQTDASKEAHQEMKPEYFSDKPSVELCTVLATLHAQ